MIAHQSLVRQLITVFRRLDHQDEEGRGGLDAPHGATGDHHIGNPIVKEAPDVELGVSEQAVHLFHRMFALETIGQGETIPDGVDGQRTGFDNPEGCIGQGKNTLGMHVLSKYLVDVVED